ncbi:hypothetical protein [Candidatus Protochlamydia phocaeensis]|uniref:hypothetical protein n=1 Tax=Candidatus Protochlamydia phocaeensis TaxID=1414722 RepID=UPI0008388F29|nr:hypothetical protein [Candidatus Protochlamydia phocaeensis]
MRKMIWAAAAFLLLSSTSGYALLPPLYEGVREIKSILTSKEFGEKLHSGEVLVAIQKNDAGYEITTNQHHLQIDVKYEQTGRIGPAEYTLYFHDPVPIK